jgi:hypothetical protein
LAHNHCRLWIAGNDSFQWIMKRKKAAGFASGFDVFGL